MKLRAECRPHGTRISIFDLTEHTGPPRYSNELDGTHSSWLIEGGMDRERMLDMDRIVAPVRQRSFLVMAAALLLCGPWLGWWTLIPLAVAGVVFKLADDAVERVSHPEYLLFAAWAGSELMIEMSDNTATNLLLQKITLARVNARLDSLHLANTRVHHLVMQRAITSIARDSSEKYGLGKTTPNEMAQLFALLAQGKAVSPKADSAMLAMLETNDETELITRQYTGVRAAHKSGKDDDVRTECGLYYLRTRVVACVLTRANADQRWIIDNEPERLMGRMGAEIAKAVGVPPKATVEQN